MWTKENQDCNHALTSFSVPSFSQRLRENTRTTVTQCMRSLCQRRQKTLGKRPVRGRWMWRQERWPMEARTTMMRRAATIWYEKIVDRTDREEESKALWEISSGQTVFAFWKLIFQNYSWPQIWESGASHEWMVRAPGLTVSPCRPQLKQWQQGSSRAHTQAQAHTHAHTYWL